MKLRPHDKRIIAMRSFSFIAFYLFSLTGPGNCEQVIFALGQLTTITLIIGSNIPVHYSPR